MVILKLSLFHELSCELQILILSGSVGLVCSLHRQLERNLSWLPELGDDEIRLVWYAFLLSEGFTSVSWGFMDRPSESRACGFLLQQQCHGDMGEDQRQGCKV
jgi:hypothetical protein